MPPVLASISLAFGLGMWPLHLPLASHVALHCGLAYGMTCGLAYGLAHDPLPIKWGDTTKGNTWLTCDPCNAHIAPCTLQCWQRQGY